MRVIIFFFLVNMGNCIAQDINDYDLQSLINKAQQHSIAFKIAESVKENSSFQYLNYKAELKPQLSIVGNLVDYSKDYFAVRQPDGNLRFQPRTQNFSSFGFGLSQFITGTGGTISINTDLTRFDDFERSNIQYSGVPIRLSLNQPLFSFNEMKWFKKIEPLKYEESKRKYESDLNEIALQTTIFFFNLLEAQADFEIARKNLDNQQIIYEIEKKRVNLGTTTKDKILQIKLQIFEFEQQLKKAEVDIESNIFNIANYVGISDNNISLISPDELPIIDMTIDDAIKKAKKNGPEFFSYLRRRLEAERDIEKSKKERFKINLTVAYGLNGVGNYLGMMYNQSKSQQSILLNVVVPILDWGRTKEKIGIAQTNLATLNYTIAQEEIALISSIRNLISKLNLISDNIIIAKKADSIGLERYNLTKEQFRFGKTSITELNIALGEKDQAKRSYISMLKEYWISYYELKALTHF